MLEKERFLAIKKLARDIRKENKEIFKKIGKKPADQAMKEKEKFIDAMIEEMAIAFSEGEQGREEKQIFRANILIPDDEEFYASYSKDKNIRSLMKKYVVNIEDIMSKITELNIYGKYLEEEETDFVDEMTKISKEQAEDLLDEIDSLSNTLTDLDLTEEKEAPKKEPKFIKPDIEEVIPETKVEIDDDFLDESFDNINNAISGFVDDYNNLKEELSAKKSEINSLKTRYEKISVENDKLTSSVEDLKSLNDSLKDATDKLKESNRVLKEENEKMSKRMTILEDKLYKSAMLLKKLYKGIKG
ncbi:MAG: hypothetical protein IKG27_03780 [Bacilli bacterium]|nr:hypothetical protein [Bacilli bacterium]